MIYLAWCCRILRAVLYLERAGGVGHGHLHKVHFEDGAQHGDEVEHELRQRSATFRNNNTKPLKFSIQCMILRNMYALRALLRSLLPRGFTDLGPLHVHLVEAHDNLQLREEDREGHRDLIAGRHACTPRPPGNPHHSAYVTYDIAQ